MAEEVDGSMCGGFDTNEFGGKGNGWGLGSFLRPGCLACLALAESIRCSGCMVSGG